MIARLHRRRQRGMAHIMTALAWVSLMVLMGFFFHELLERQRNPNREPHSEVSAEGVREVVLRRNRQGHYLANGLINGEPVVFLLDTGATGVAVPAELAQRIGLRRGQALQTRTANGMAVAWATRLDRVRLGAIEQRNVSAAISPGLGGNEVLLGMSFLRDLEFSQRGNRLTLRQHP